jgi:clan AA aspartic protease
MTRATVSREFVLPAKPEDFVGEVRVQVQLENYDDWSAARAGYLSGDLVRAVTVDMLVDTGAANLLLGRDVVEQLGLAHLGTMVVEYADGRRDELDVAGIVRLSVGGRVAEVRALVGPESIEPLLGQVPLEILDLLVDCSQQRLVPRPDSPINPFSKLK